MRKQATSILTIIAIVLAINGYAQTTYSKCNVYTINSPNNDFYLRTIPFDNIKETSLGKTVVYNSDSLVVYEIPRYFEISKNGMEVFLSNDGQTIAYVVNSDFYCDGIKHNSIEILKNGISFKNYPLADLIDCNKDLEYCFLRYSLYEYRDNGWYEKDSLTEFENQIVQKSTYLKNDTLHIFTNDFTVLDIDLNTGNFNKNPITELSKEIVNTSKPIIITSELFPAPYGRPLLANGLTVEKGLAQNLNMTVVDIYDRSSHKYKLHRMFIEIIVDRNGKAIVDNIKYNNGLPEDEINDFVNSELFDVKSIPKVADAWRFSTWVNLRNGNKKEARKERKHQIIEEQRIYQERLIADSINGVYIPRNIEECFLELNKLLSTKDINMIKNAESRDNTIRFHLDIGLWLRNNWGLWGGSRIQNYLRSKGINHPDDMSAMILRLYYDWLHDEHDEWEKLNAS